VSRYADKRQVAVCAWANCDQEQPATQLAIYRGTVNWFCDRCIKYVKPERAK
jgi:hypothetical protein